MKKQKFHKFKQKAKAYHAILRFGIFNNYAVRPIEETISRINKYKGVIKNYIEYLREDLKLIYKDWKGGPKYKPDNRTGEQTYGYKSIEEIEGNLSYISDRFSAEFRLQWLLDLPEGYKKLAQDKINLTNNQV